jgi:hypothetical protein
MKLFLLFICEIRVSYLKVAVLSTVFCLDTEDITHPSTLLYACTY